MKAASDAKIKIEKGVPIPAKGSGINSRYPFGKMEIGDSIFIPNMLHARITGAFTRHIPKKFAVRTMDGGVRVWRIA